MSKTKVTKTKPKATSKAKTTKAKATAKAKTTKAKATTKAKTTAKAKATTKTKATTKAKTTAKAKAPAKSKTAAKTKATTKSKAKAKTTKAPKEKKPHVFVGKPKMFKTYEKLDPAIVSQIKLENPSGFEKNLIMFKGIKGKLMSALPFEAEDFYYMVRMTKEQAQDIIIADEDYDSNGNLKSSAVEQLTASLK